MFQTHCFIFIILFLNVVESEVALLMSLKFVLALFLKSPKCEELSCEQN
jgi:hypothetical protein